jgi:hypothetical protein
LSWFSTFYYGFGFVVSIRYLHIKGVNIIPKVRGAKNSPFFGRGRGEKTFNPYFSSLPSPTSSA